MRLRHLRLSTATCIPELVNDNAFFEAASDRCLPGLQAATERSPIDEHKSFYVCKLTPVGGFVLMSEVAHMMLIF